eukprot:GHRQ01028053.1.p2 GENE.GHRQ01028053.1~~GHRQ01028053.1.p2  ORF type:complete len:106 (+),score=34.29 GHRQ01028053.1:368-685(+)
MTSHYLQAVSPQPYETAHVWIACTIPLHTCCAGVLQFIWANYLRPRVPMVLMAVPDVEAYVHHGISHAMHPDAKSLPGYTALSGASKEQLQSMSCLGHEQLQAVE